jgi:anti-sigma regulatory factor (Ser/Thr protein kinase)/predicted ArsR family transcriptional regulator
VEWFLDPPSATSVTQLRREIAAYLRRHAHDRHRVWAAETIVGELVSNAVDHAGGPIWVSLDWGGRQPVLTVHDLGAMFELEPRLPELSAERGRGLWMVSQLATDLAVAAKRSRGKRVSVTLPVHRRVEAAFDPPPRRIDPAPMSGSGSSTMDREAFLRTLVVELALAAEETNGPNVAQAMVARVGSTIGSQVEREYRESIAVSGPLTPHQIAECYTQLKTSVGGAFFVADLATDRIVLGNTRCPFGAAVSAQPALCRITSSVLGGIAARSSGTAVVSLEERIAVGDPECRIAVLLGERAKRADTGHRYHSAGESVVSSRSCAPAPSPG